MSKSLNEVFKDKLVRIKENKEEKNITINGAFAKADVKNSNGRTYSSTILQREILKMQKLIESGESVFSTAGENELKVENISHKINEIYWDEEEKLGHVNVELLPTKSGKIVKTLIQAGGGLFFAMQGMGEVNPQGEVKSDYQLKNINISLSSSFPDSKFNVVGESFSMDKQGLSEEEIQNQFTQAKLANFKGNLQMYKERIVQPRKITDKEAKQFSQAKIAGYQGKIEDYLKIKK